MKTELASTTNDPQKVVTYDIASSDKLTVLKTTSAENEAPQIALNYHAQLRRGGKSVRKEVFR